MNSNLPLSEQIRVAQHEWALAQREYDLLEGMRAVLRDREVNKLMEEQKLSEARAKLRVIGSEWYESYMRNVVEAKYAALDARGKWEHLNNLAKEERELGYQERAMMKI